IEFASGDGTATLCDIRRATTDLLELGIEGRRKHFDPARAAVILPAAVILETIMEHLGIARIRAAKRRLRDGILRAMASKIGLRESAQASRLPVRYAPAG